MGFKLTTIEEFESATDRLLETGKKVGADSWQMRVKNQTPHCKFGEQGICCRICSMGPCRITPKAPRGICGCDAHGIVGRNFLRFTAGGAATHTGQRDMIRVRISKATFEAGFRAKDLAEVLYANIKNEFDAVVDKCAVTIITDEAECTKLRHELAIPAYDRRDERLTTLTDEAVPVYYSCIMCQAFSPSHVCVVTPERLGLCGAVSWLDAKATNELDPQGPCQVITKERVIDENLGRYEDVDKAVAKFSQGALEHVTLYSIYATIVLVHPAILMYNIDVRC